MSIAVEDIGVAILAGGKSSRMGTDKGLVLLEGLPLIERITRQRSHLFANIFIVTKPGPGDTTCMDITSFFYQNPIYIFHF